MSRSNSPILLYTTSSGIPFLVNNEHFYSEDIKISDLTRTFLRFAVPERRETDTSYCVSIYSFRYLFIRDLTNVVVIFFINYNKF